MGLVACSICGEPKSDRFASMCAACGRAWDRHRRTDDGTLVGAMKWAAERAARFAVDEWARDWVNARLTTFLPARRATAHARDDEGC